MTRKALVKAEDRGVALDFKGKDQENMTGKDNRGEGRKPSIKLRFWMKRKGV